MIKIKKYVKCGHRYTPNFRLNERKRGKVKRTQSKSIKYMPKKLSSLRIALMSYFDYRKLCDFNRNLRKIKYMRISNISKL